MRKDNKKSVLVAMSGGVDSSVAAAILKKQGFEVAGAFMHFWIEPGSKKDGIENKCCSAEAERIARQVAARLDIPFYVFHFEKEFKKAVVDYFLDEFKRGRTPNPCVVCNQELKFGVLFKKALELDFDYLATGHYARLRRQARRRRELTTFKLLKAKDKNKDQSYFLWTLGQRQLKRLLFPVGDYTKQEVYELAENWKLPYRKAESFDICFIAGRHHNEFLKKYLKLKSGPIVATNGKPRTFSAKKVRGKVVGQHEGLPLYTIGQRKEIGIGGVGPYYVIGGDLKTNTLLVTNKPYDRRLYSKALIAQEVNWVSDQPPKLPLRCQARIRYGHAAVPAVVKSLKLEVKSLRGRKKRQVLVEFDRAQRAVTPGQSVAFYQRSEVLGGGVIR